MMKIVFSDHFFLKTDQRKIPKTFVLRTIMEADFIRLTRHSREARYKKFKNYYLKVILLNKGHLLIVITAYWTLKIK